MIYRIAYAPFQRNCMKLFFFNSDYSEADVRRCFRAFCLNYDYFDGMIYKIAYAIAAQLYEIIFLNLLRIK